MRTPTINDGMRSSQEIPREQAPSLPAHLPEAQGKTVFVCYKGGALCRSAYLELVPEKKTVINGVVVTEPKLDVRFKDGIVVLDPKNADGATKIAAIKAHEYYVTGGLLKIRNREDVIEEQETARAMRHLEEHDQIMQDPRMAARLRQLASKSGFGVAVKETGEAEKP